MRAHRQPIVLVGALAPHRPAEERGGRVDDHAAHVGVRVVGPLDAAPLHQRLGEHVLDDVLGVVGIAQEATRQSHQGRSARGHELLEVQLHGRCPAPDDGVATSAPGLRHHFGAPPLTGSGGDRRRGEVQSHHVVRRSGGGGRCIRRREAILPIMRHGPARARRRR